MVICLCKGVNDKTIRRLLETGSVSVRDIMLKCKAGSDCGSCVCHIKELVQQAKTQNDDGQVG